MSLNLDNECNKRGSPGKLMLMMCMLLRMMMIAIIIDSYSDKIHILNVPRQGRERETWLCRAGQGRCMA